MMQQVSSSWGIRPWWKAVKWWWAQGDQFKAIVIAITAAIPAAVFSIRNRAWEATETVTLQNGERK